jgi:hypothetical protein
MTLKLAIPTLLLILAFHHMAAAQSAKDQATPEESPLADAEPNSSQLRLGIIGLDTSHAPAFAKLINSAGAEDSLSKMRVVAAFPGGSDDIAASRDRVENFTNQIRELQIEITSSIEALLPKVDAVLLLSVDGRKHLPQVLPVFRSGKPVFIDKPLAGNLVDAIAIDLLAKKYQARWFSSSSLRFSPAFFRFRQDQELADNIRGAASWGPCSLETTHTDLYWYGVHGVELLYTAMGTGCQSVIRTSTPGTDVVVGVWDEGRVGSFRGLRDGKAGYGLVVFGEKEIAVADQYSGYGPLVEEIGEFFFGAEPPVSNRETLEMFTFMQAADASKESGQAVQLEEVWQAAYQQAEQKVNELDPTH